MLRSILFDDITEQRYQGLVFSTLRSLLRARLIAKMPWNYVDATNLDTPDTGHMQRMVLTILDENHHTEEWTFLDHDKEHKEVFDLHRKV